MYNEVQKGFRSIGFGPNLEPFNPRVLSILTTTFLGVVSLWMFLFYEADSAEQYMESVCVITVCTGTLLSFASTVQDSEKLFSFIKADDEYLNESKLNIFFGKNYDA